MKTMEMWVIGILIAGAVLFVLLKIKKFFTQPKNFCGSCSGCGKGKIEKK